MAPTFLLLSAITNETVKLTQINRFPAASSASRQKHLPIALVGIPYVRS